MAKKKKEESLNEVFKLNEDIINDPEVKLIQDRPSQPIQIEKKVIEKVRYTHEKPVIQTNPLSMLGDRFEIWKDGKKIFDTDMSRVLPTSVPGFIIINGSKYSTSGLNYIVK